MKQPMEFRSVSKMTEYLEQLMYEGEYKEFSITMYEEHIELEAHR